MDTAIMHKEPITLGVLCLSLLLVFYLSNHESKILKRFFDFIPPMLLCYFIPAFCYYPLGIIDGEKSSLYSIAKDYFLPASLILLSLSMDLKSVASLGSKALIMFITTVIAVIVSGPIALWVSQYIIPETYATHGDNLWRGLSTIAGSWIGGAPNQAAMKEIYHVPQDLFGSLLVVDVFVSYVWMAILLYGANKTKAIDRYFKADVSAIQNLKEKNIEFKNLVTREGNLYDLVKLFSIVFAAVGLSHLIGELMVAWLDNYKPTLEAYNMTTLTSKFFWVVISATTFGVMMSISKLRKLEGIGASKFGTLFIYFLVATIGMQMNLAKVFTNAPLLIIGFIWMALHVAIILIVAKLIKAPFFFTAVASQACIGGPASAPVVASAFDPALAPVGVLLAVLGYAVGTYGAMVCAGLMSGV